MMYPRLKLARNLLKDDGVIFISIDDNEVHNLRKICDEIFGSENFVNEFIWRSGRTSAAIYTKEHEYVLAYSKNIESLNLIQYNEDDEIISDRAIKKISVKNPASEITFPSGMRFEAEDKVFPKEFGISEVITVVKGELKCNNKLLANEVTLRAGWIMKDMIEAWITGDEVYDSKGQRVTEFFFRENGVLQYVKEKGTIHPKTIIQNYSTKSGTNEMIELMGFGAFNYPKPIGLIKFLQQISKKDSIILDFFSGSATTAHAVMKLNAEDGGNRRYIMVQLPEKTPEDHEARKERYETIAEIGKERIRRAGEKIKEEFKDKEGIENLDIGFKVFKLDESNFTAWNMNHSDIYGAVSQMKNTIMGSSSPEDAFYEVLLKLGIDISLPVEEIEIKGKKIYSLAGHYVLACFDKNLSLDIIEEMARLSSETETIVVSDDVFKDNLTKLNAEETLKRNHVKFLRVV